MEREIVAVPTRGVERWLAQRLSSYLGQSPLGGDGVCANVDFPSPALLLEEITAAALGTAAPPGSPEAPGVPGVRGAYRGEGASAAIGQGPWAPSRSVWALIDVMDDHIDEPGMAALKAHLCASSPAGSVAAPRRFATARRLTGLFASYCIYRPEMVLSWLPGPPGEGSPECGDDVGPDDGLARGQDTAWQADLWRHLRRGVGVPSPAELADWAPAVIEEAPGRLRLPARLSLFGLTRLPASQLRILKAVAAHRDVHLFLLHPSEVLWEKVARAVPHPARGLLRAEDPSTRAAANPLLRSWGRDSREMQLVLAAQGVGGGEHRPAPEGGTSLLRRLQADIRADRAPPGGADDRRQDPRPLLDDGDFSVQVHSCHGRARQVEVVREAVLHLLAADPSLEPRDVIIMCPDIENFAPLVQASFEAAGLSGGPALRARLADRSLRQTNPLLAVAAALLDLAASRVTSAEVLDFASRPPVSRRFGFDQDQLARAEGWLEGTGVRWGLDAVHRRPWRLGELADGTWRAGLDRLLLGAAMSEEGDRLFGAVLPYDDVPSGDIDLAGRLAELVSRLEVCLDSLKEPQSAASWAAALLAGTGRLALAPADEQWQVEQVRDAFEDIVATPEGQPGGRGRDGREVLLDLSEARALLADCLRGRPTRANFRTGDMTICTLLPMRSVPHRVVCLLGLDDGHFPRPAEIDGDDLLLCAPRVGDRDVPSEDRQLLLDALLAAQEHFIVTFEGRDQHLNQHRPPAVPVSELLDVVDRTVRLVDGRLARDAIVTQHPLQPFDPANFAPGSLGTAGPWRFDAPQLEGARALVAPREKPGPFLVQPLPPLDRPTVQLASLVRFLEHPVRAFLRERMGLYAGDPTGQLSGSLPVELDPLQRWALGDRLLQEVLAGAGAERALEAERGRGLLPPAALGDSALREVVGVVDTLVREVNRLPCASLQPLPFEVNVQLPDGTRVVGTVPGARGAVMLRCTYSKLGPKHRLRSWAQFLALSAAHPEIAPSAIVVGQADGSTPSQPRASSVTLRPFEGPTGAVHSSAVVLLQVLVDLYRRGMREPLPLYCATSCAWATAVFDEESPKEAARERWASSFDELPGENAEPEHTLVLGRAPFDDLLAALPGEDEGGPGWGASSGSRFGNFAVRLWSPILRHERQRGR